MKRNNLTKKIFKKFISCMIGLGALLLMTCDGGTLAEGLMPTQDGDGPIVIFDLYHKPLPKVPLPTNIAARPDPDSPTGIRLNVSHHAETEVESGIRRQIDDLDGWGTYSPISAAFECEGDRDGICLDLDNIARRHHPDGYDFSDDAIYVVNIQKEIPNPENPEEMIPNPDYGRPVPLDIGAGNFPLYLDRAGYYYPNDPRADAPTTYFESENEVRGEDVDCDGRLDEDEDANGNLILDPGEDIDGDGWLDIDEDTNGNGKLDRPEALDSDENANGELCVGPDFYEPAFDTNFDGEMGRANVWCTAEEYFRGKCHCLQGRECPKNLDPNDPEDMEKLAYLLDPFWHTIYYYEIETNSLLMRSLVPLKERNKYAVFMTDRLVGEAGRPVRSPFQYINHTEQTGDLSVLPDILASDDGEYFGGLGLENIRHAWVFSTQSITTDLQELRRGLYGHGKFARLADDFPPLGYVNRTWACNPLDASCDEEEDLTEDQNKHHFVVSRDDLLKIILYYADEIFGLSVEEVQAILDGFDYIDYFVIGHFWSPNFLDSDGDGVEEYRHMNEDVDGDGKLEYSEDKNCNGILDPGEDLDGDGNLDTSEDDNMNGILDPGEDKDGDGHLDKNEDLNFNCELDVVSKDEGYWEINTHTGEGKYGRHLVPYFISIPKEEFKIKGMEDEPFPVVFYGHGYTSMLIESLGFAGSLAQHGLASVGVNCVHHGLGEGDIDQEMLKSVFEVENLTGLSTGFLMDRAVDMNGDGMLESAGDFWTAYIFHTRDMVRQSALDHFNLIRIMRSWDGETLAAPMDIDGDGVNDEKWDFVNWTGDSDSEYYELVGDYDSDGRIDLAGDFNADGRIDVGGPDNFYYAWGQSLGGIMSALMGGVDPAIKAIAPTSGGGGLGDIGVRSTQGGVKEAVILRAIGPIVVSKVVTEHMVDRMQTVCDEGNLSLAFTVPDLNDDVNIEFACACFGDNDCPDRPEYIDHVKMEDDSGQNTIHMAPGDGVVVYNVPKQEKRCALVGNGGEVRMSYPSDLLERVEIAVYDGSDGVPFLDFEECEVAQEGLLKAYIRTWRRPQKFQFWEWSMLRREGDEIGYAPVGEPLVSPAEGYGIVKNTPAFRSFLAIGQVGLDPGDPINYAPHYYLDPLYYPEEEAYYGSYSITNAIIVGTVGDMNVPVNTAAAQGRATGILDMHDTDTPWGRSINQVYLDNYMIEAIERNMRNYPDDASGTCTAEAAPDGCPILFDTDDLDRGCDGTGSPYLERPTRAWSPSDRSDWGECELTGADGDTGYDKWECGECVLLTSTTTTPPEIPSKADTCRPGTFVERVTCPGGVSLMLWPYIDPDGTHGFDIPSPCKPFDVNMFMINMIGHYFRTEGTEISFEMCNQFQPRVDAMDPGGRYYLFCPFWEWWTCPACPNRLCDRDWYQANHPPSCPDEWEDIPENEHQLLDDYYTTVCPCQGVACSDHGTCEAVDGEPTCDCDEGYEPDGLECIPIEV